MKRSVKVLLVAIFLFLSFGTKIVSGMNKESVVPLVNGVNEGTVDDNLERDRDENVNPNVNDPDRVTDPNTTPGPNGTIDTPDYNVPGGPLDDRDYTNTGDNNLNEGNLENDNLNEGNLENDNLIDDDNNLGTIAISAVAGLIIGSLLTYYFAVPKRV